MATSIAGQPDAADVVFSAVVALPPPRGTEDADEENNADISSVNFSEVGDRRATSLAGQLDAEDGAFTAVAVGHMERQTSLVYKTDLTEERLAFWKQARSIRGELVGNPWLLVR